MAEDDFLGFRTLVSGWIIKTAYAAGFFLVTVVGLFWLAYPFGIYFMLPESERRGMPPSAGLHIVGAALLLTFGNILWRVVCEAWMLMFSVHEMLSSIEKSNKRIAELLETRQS